MGRTILILELLFVFLPRSALADVPIPWSDKRVVDAYGRYYVVIKLTEDPNDRYAVDYVIAEQKPGTAPVTPAESKVDYEDKMLPNPDVAVREGDLVLGNGRLERPPGEILVSSTGLGFVSLSVWGGNNGEYGRSNSLIIVSADGKLRHRKHLDDLFSESELRLFDETLSTIWWDHGAWFDESRRQVIVVADAYKSEDDRSQALKAADEDEPNFKSYLFRTVSIDSGKVGNSSDCEVIKAISELNRGALKLALEVTDEMKLSDAAPHLPRILGDDTMDLDIRLRAAGALATFGNSIGATLIANTARRKPEQWNETQEYAILHLRESLGADAAPVLQKVIGSSHDLFYYEVWDEFNELGESALPTLVQMLDDLTNPVGQRVAAECLGEIGAPAKCAVPALIKILKGHTKSKDTLRLHCSVASALGRIGPDARPALPFLLRLADQTKAEWDKIREKESHNKSAVSSWELTGAEHDHESVTLAVKRIQAVSD